MQSSYSNYVALFQLFCPRPWKLGRGIKIHREQRGRLIPLGATSELRHCKLKEQMMTGHTDTSSPR